MRLNHTSGNHSQDLDSVQSRSRFLLAQNRCKQQNRHESMLQRAASEVGLTVESLKA
ncbi:hypothetical protein [Crocosphaera sp. XPORK-15E]|uniref:hypothetical protein n=1 Tax=Crocosphaera sp. XPORK-15E TaxID=3110247 RepID=UPI002B2085C2|nr:hypothetical protein [Crocosphaera sp. XPORK-15E]MEA5533782.1 hypothetical protein [Crocosphaera sp. XPORK-15E]